MCLRLQELQESDSRAQKIRAAGLQEDWEELDGVFHHQGLPYVPKIIRSKLISRQHNDPLAGHFRVDKTRELIGWKYYWLSLIEDVKSYVKGWDICLTLKAVRHKLYGNL